jgi:hypothetical protein
VRLIRGVLQKLEGGEVQIKRDSTQGADALMPYYFKAAIKTWTARQQKTAFLMNGVTNLPTYEFIRNLSDGSTGDISS